MPLEKAHKAIAALYEYRDTVLKNRVDPDLGCSVLGVTSLDARSAINLLPGEAVFTIDRRFNPGETFESVTTEILSVLEKVKANDPEFQYEYEITASTPIFDIPRDHPLTKAIQDAYIAVRKQPLEIIAVPWGSDAAHISYRSGVPMPILGPGMMDMIQNEKVSLSNLFDITEIYALTVMQLLS